MAPADSTAMDEQSSPPPPNPSWYSPSLTHAWAVAEVANQMTAARVSKHLDRGSPPYLERTQHKEPCRLPKTSTFSQEEGFESVTDFTRIL